MRAPRPRVIEPHAIYFKDGAAVLTRKDWLIRKHYRDMDKVVSELGKPAKESPWRRDAIGYLRGLGSHRRGDFQILE